jgi:Skp family chaperone for outer membrane proteins
MNKVVMLAVGLAAVTATYAVSRLAFAQGQPGPAPAATRIGVVNIEALLQSYKKAQVYNADLEKGLKPLRTQAEALKQKLLQRQSELKVANLDAGTRKQYEEANAKDMKKLDDLERQAQILRNNKAEKELLPIYKEIIEAVKLHARTNAIQVVLTYSEDPKIDPFSRTSIVRRVNGLETGCVAPLYVDPAVDITGALTDTLNKRYDASAQTPRR